MFYVHSVTLIVKWLAIGVVSIDFALIGYILYRRVSRNRYYAQKDAAQTRYSGTVAEYFAGNLAQVEALQKLRTRTRAEREAVETLLLAGLNGARRKRATELLFALGYVAEWTERAFGNRRAGQLLEFIGTGRCISALPDARRRRTSRFRRLRALSVSRAVAVGRLGRLSQEFSDVFMREALRDPSPYVGRLGVAAIGRNPIPCGVPVLLEELRKSIEGQTEIPVRSIKTALVRYPISELRHFTAFMDHHSSRFRFLAVDTVREICRKSRDSGVAPAEFPAELRAWFLQKAVRDDSADVRARSAAVVSYFRDVEAVQALRVLLRDENEFVRLHTVRSCSAPYYSDLVGDVVQRITDNRWRVREAAVRTVAGFSATGRRELARFFLETGDRYASEQIADEFQRSGLVFEIASALASSSGDRRQASDVCAKMVRLGMDSILTGLVADDRRLPEVRGRLMDVLAASNSPQFLSALQQIAATQTDPLTVKASGLLRAHQLASAAAAGEQGRS